MATSRVCEGFADAFRDSQIDVVAGPTTGGIILAYEVGRQLEVAAAYDQRLRAGSKAIFHLEAFLARFMSVYKGFLSSMVFD